MVFRFKKSHFPFQVYLISVSWIYLAIFSVSWALSGMLFICACANRDSICCALALRVVSEPWSIAASLLAMQSSYYSPLFFQLRPFSFTPSSKHSAALATGVSLRFDAYLLSDVTLRLRNLIFPRNNSVGNGVWVRCSAVSVYVVGRRSFSCSPRGRQRQELSIDTRFEHRVLSDSGGMSGSDVLAVMSCEQERAIFGEK